MVFPGEEGKHQPQDEGRMVSVLLLVRKVSDEKCSEVIWGTQ